MSGPSQPAGDPAFRAELVAAFVRQGKTEAEAAALAGQVEAFRTRPLVTAHGPGIDEPRQETARDGGTRQPRG
jgi:hypothetical protein